MKKTIVFLLISCVVFSGFAQSFRPFTALRVIKTEHFDIIFPEKSRRTAEAVAGFAEACYGKVSALLKNQVRTRIPVTVTPDTDAFSAYMNPVPYPHIVLFDTPMDIEWTSFRNSIESVFLHELTHAFSTSSRGPVGEFLAGIFGGWIIPSVLNSPIFMTEGVTVSFESLEGFGRANDPLIRERIAQSIREGKFPTPFQASGAWDKGGINPYHYGGYFSAYIQKRWGMEKYAALWKGMGTRLPLSINFYDHGFFKIFREVYGADFLEVWADFAASMTVVGLEDNRDNLLVGGELQFDELAAGGGKLFFVDSVACEVMAYDPYSGKSVRAAPVDSTASDIDVSSDGKRLLVASYRYDNSLAAAVVTEFDTDRGAKTGRTWSGLYRPRYFRDGVVGIAPDLHAPKLVFIDGEGKQTTLLSGDAETLYSCPAPLDENRVAFIAAVKGVRRIGVYDLRSASAVLLASNLGDDADRFKYVRGLRARNGRLYFSYTTGQRFYKLGMIDENGALFSERDFSGGVFSVTELDGVLYYRAAYATWDALQRYPERLSALTGTRAAVSAAAFAPEPAAAAIVPKTAEQAFSALPYLNPFSCWLPFPLLNTDGQTLRMNGAGFVSYMSDPTDTDTVFLFAGYDSTALMGFASVSWTSYGLGVPFAVSASDQMERETSRDANADYRATRASLSISKSLPLGSERESLTFGTSASAAVRALDPQNGTSAYQWRYASPSYAFGASLVLSNLYRPSWRLFGSGAKAAFYGYYSLPSSTYRAEAVLRAAIEPALPARATAFAAYDGGGMTIAGTSATYGSVSFEGLSEYAADVPSGLIWLAGGSAELSALTMETQGNFTHFYFNRLFAVLGWRGAAYGSGGETGFAHSVFAKLGAVMTAMPVASIPLKFTPYLWIAYKLSNLNDANSANDYSLGFSLSLTL